MNLQQYLEVLINRQRFERVDWSHVDTRCGDFMRKFGREYYRVHYCVDLGRGLLCRPRLYALPR